MDRDNPQPEIGDAFGNALLAYLEGTTRFSGGPLDVVYERDDGLVNADSGNHYFDGVDEWPERDLWAIERADGRVLDFGAGAGRASLALQDRGQGVLALDVSPGAIETCQRRGVRDTLCGEITDLVSDPSQKFDTLLALGNNLGLLGTAERAAEIFDAFTALSSPGATIVGTCLDPTAGEAPPWHASYHERNRQAGLPPGQIRLRARHLNITTPWFDLYWMSPEELDGLARRSGWQVADVLPGLIYGAVLTRVE